MLLEALLCISTDCSKLNWNLYVSKYSETFSDHLLVMVKLLVQVISTYKTILQILTNASHDHSNW